MADRPFPEPEREPAPGDQWARAAHPVPRRGNGSPLGRGSGAAVRDRGREGGGRGPERVENRLVADGAAPTSSEAGRRRKEHLCHERRLEHVRVAGPEPRLDERGPVERPGRPANRRNEPVADGAEQVPRRRLGRKLGEELVDRPESRREVVAVVPVAEDGVEPRQRRGMPLDRSEGAPEPGPEVSCIDPFDRRRRRG